jgi:hypothetical protein
VDVRALPLRGATQLIELGLRARQQRELHPLLGEPVLRGDGVHHARPLACGHADVVVVGVSADGVALGNHALDERVGLRRDRVAPTKNVAVMPWRTNSSSTRGVAPGCGPSSKVSTTSPRGQRSVL